MLRLFGFILLTAFVCLFVIPGVALLAFILGTRLLQWLGL